MKDQKTPLPVFTHTENVDERTMRIYCNTQALIMLNAEAKARLVEAASVIYGIGSEAPSQELPVERDFIASRTVMLAYARDVGQDIFGLEVMEKTLVSSPEYLRAAAIIEPLLKQEKEAIESERSARLAVQKQIADAELALKEELKKAQDQLYQRPEIAALKSKLDAALARAAAR